MKRVYSLRILAALGPVKLAVISPKFLIKFLLSMTLLLRCLYYTNQSGCRLKAFLKP